MDILFWISGGYVLLLTHIWFHELGHYSVGRFLVRIPKENIQIKLFQYPAHVALRDQDENWITPNDEEGNFVRTYFNYDPDGKKSFLFVTGGFILQTVIFLCAAFAFYYFFDNIALANFIIGGSFIFNIVYIFGDVIAAIWKHSPAGDVSSAFQFAPLKTVLFVIVLLLSYGVSYFYIGF